MDQIKNLLKNRKLKITDTRVEVLHLIQSQTTAVSYTSIQNQLLNTDRITLYRTLNTLLDAGLIHKAYVTNNETFYASCETSCSSHKHDDKHIHFKCDTCKIVSCITVNHNFHFSIPNYQIKEVNINVSGICVNCNLNRF